MFEWMDNQNVPDNYRPVEVNENVLKHMRHEEVFVVDMTHIQPQYPLRYFKNMVPDVAIFKCEKCNKFFNLDEYEFAYMEIGHCPFCKNVEKDKGPKNVYGSLADMRM
jgi:phage FluMu protein Com